MALGRIGRSVVLAAAIATIWTGVRLGLAARFGIPGPVVQDEFSLLLGADTFAHGRLVNPPHPMAKFFESPHLLVRPVYASKYPPGRAFLLALGQKFFGSPFYGVVASGAFMIFAICLMLCVWVPLVWSLVVTVSLAFYLLPPMYWVNSYWGGCVAAAGGALVLLAIGLHRGGRPAWAGWTFGLGVMILLLTRPYEGGVFTLAALAMFHRELRGKSIRIALASAAPVLIAGLLWTAHYNRVATGNALEFPEALHDRQYDVAPVFWFLPLRADRSYSHPRLAAFHGENGLYVWLYRRDHPWWIGLGVGLGVSFIFVAILIGPLCLALFLLPFAWRDPRVRRYLAILGIVVAALSIETQHTQHYGAPAAGAVAILIALSLERAWRIQLKRFPVGRVVTTALIIFAISYSSLRAKTAAAQEPPGSARAKLVHKLESLGKPQLVFVHYPSPGWHVEREWVYNGADIDRRAVVFAHDLGPQEDARLLAYYPNRQAWLVSMDDSGYRLDPYPR